MRRNRRNVKLKKVNVLDYVEIFDPATGTVAFGIYVIEGAKQATTLQYTAPAASLLLSISDKQMYINTGTQASPTWTAISAQS